MQSPQQAKPLTIGQYLCSAERIVSELKGEAGANSQLDEPQPTPELGEIVKAKPEQPTKVDVDPIDSFFPLPSQSQVKEYATEQGASMLITIYRKERFERERAERGREDALRKFDDMKTSYHELQMTLTTKIHEGSVTLTKQCHDLELRHATVADRLRHMRRESWVAPVLTMLSGILLSAFWKTKEDEPARWYLLFGGLLLAGIAVVVLALRGFRKPTDEGR